MKRFPQNLGFYPAGNTTFFKINPLEIIAEKWLIQGRRILLFFFSMTKIGVKKNLLLLIWKTSEGQLLKNQYYNQRNR